MPPPAGLGDAAAAAVAAEGTDVDEVGWGGGGGGGGGVAAAQGGGDGAAATAGRRDGDDDVEHPCPISLGHEDDAVVDGNHAGMCFACGQSYCGACRAGGLADRSPNLQCTIHYLA